MVAGVVIAVVLVAYVPFLIWKARVVRPKTFVSHLHPEAIRGAFEQKVATTGWKIIDSGNPMIAQSPLLGGIRQQVALLLEPHDSGVEGSYETIRYVKKVLTGVPTKGVTLGLRRSAFFKELQRLEAATPPKAGTAPLTQPQPVLPTEPGAPPPTVGPAPVVTPPPMAEPHPTVGPPPGVPAVTPEPPLVTADAGDLTIARPGHIADAPLDGFDDDEFDLTVRRDMVRSDMIPPLGSPPPTAAVPQVPEPTPEIPEAIPEVLPQDLTGTDLHDTEAVRQQDPPPADVPWYVVSGDTQVGPADADQAGPHTSEPTSGAAPATPQAPPEAGPSEEPEAPWWKD